MKNKEANTEKDGRKGEGGIPPARLLLEFRKIYFGGNKEGKRKKNQNKFT